MSTNAHHRFSIGAILLAVAALTASGFMKAFGSFATTAPPSASLRPYGVHQTSEQGSVPHILQVDGTANNGDYINPSICPATCFAASASYTTVPYFSLDEPRSVTIVYNGDQAAPRPFVYADVNGADGTGVGINAFNMSATLNGSPITFTTGSTTLSFAGTLQPIRLEGEFDARSFATNVYPLAITVKAFYADGSTVQKTVNASLMILNEGSSPLAKGWTFAGIQHLYSTIGGGYLATGGDGSGTRFSALGIKATDYSRLTFDNASATYTRTYSDGSRVIFNSIGQETSLIDVTGRTYSYWYDPQGRLQEVRDPFRKQPDGTITAIGLSYDANGLHMIQEPGVDGTKWHGLITWVTVDANRCLTSAQDPDGVPTQFTCDANGRLSTVTDRRGKTTTFGYDPSTWKVAQLTLPQVPIDAGGGNTTLTNPVAQFSHWQTSGPMYITDPAGRTTTIQVNRYGQVVDFTDPAALHATIAFSGVLPTLITHPSGARDTVAYDTLGRVIRSHPAGKGVVTYHYGSNGLVDVISGTGARVDSIFYNFNNLPYRIVFGGTTRQTVNYGYDANTLRLADSYDDAGHEYIYTYDPKFGNLASEIPPSGQTTTRVFDGYGRDSITTLPASAPHVSLYDAINRLTSSSVGGSTVTYSYDGYLPADVYDASNNHYHTDYNSLGLPTSVCDPFSLCVTTRYDASGLLTSTTTKRGQLITLTRDGAGRVTSRSGTGITPSYFSYSTNGRDMVAWNSVERDSLFAVPDSQGLPWRDSVVTWVDGKRYRIFHRYPKILADSDLVTITSNTGTSFHNRLAIYSTSGFLRSFTIGSSSLTFTPNTDATALTVSMPGGGTRTSQDIALHSTGSVSFSNPPLDQQFKRVYRYDPRGRISQMTRTGMSGSPSTVFGYDNLGRLSARQEWTNCSPNPADTLSGTGYSCSSLVTSDAFTYDAMGNRTDAGGVPTTGNRYAAFNGAAWYYDADGNVVQKYKNGVYNRQYYWNADNQLDSAIKDSWYRTSYDYNAFGKPVRVWDGDPNGRHIARYLLWDGDALAAELTPSGQREVDYAYLPGSIDRPVAHTLGATTPSTVRFHEIDEIGNVIGTSESGAVSQSNGYDAWGNVSIGGNADSHLFWKGLFWNGDLTGLYFNRNRWYDPEGGRFVNEDPVGTAGGVNPYSFAGNDPITGSDPLGLCTWDAIIKAVVQFLAEGGSDVYTMVCHTLGTVYVTPGPDAPPDNPTGLPGIPSSPHGGGIGSVGLEGPPNSFVENGKNLRLYGKDGWVKTDFDFHQPHGDQTLPHAHDWGPSADSRGLPNAPRGWRPVEPGEIASPWTPYHSVLSALVQLLRSRLGPVIPIIVMPKCPLTLSGCAPSI